MAEPKMVVVVGATDDELKAGLESARANIKKFADDAKNQAERASSAWESASKRMGAGLLAMSAGLAAGLGAAGTQSAKFDAAMRYVNSAAKLPEAQFQKLEAQVLSLSRSLNTDQGPQAMAKGLYDIYGAGFEGAKAMALLTVSTKAATAGMTDTSTAAKAMTTIMEAYHLPAEKAALAGDILFKTVDKGRVEFNELAQSIGPAAVKAAAFGVSLEEVGASMAILTRTMPASESSTVLERLITSLAAPTRESAKEFQKLGIEVGAAALQHKGLVPVIQQVIDATGGNDSKLRLLLHSQEAVTGAIALGGAGAKDYASILDQMQHAVGSLDQALGEQMKSTLKQLGVLMKEGEVAAISFAKTLLPLADNFIKVGTEAVRAFNDATPATKAYAAQAGLVAAAVTSMGGAIFLALPQIAALPTAFNNGTAAARKLVGFIGLDLVGAFAIATPLAAGLAVAWATDFGHVREKTQAVLAGMRYDFQEFATWLKTQKFEMPGLKRQNNETEKAEDYAGLSPETAMLKHMAATMAPSIWGPAGRDPGKRAEAETRANVGKALLDPGKTAAFFGPLQTSAELLKAASDRLASAMGKKAFELAKAGTDTRGPDRKNAEPGFEAKAPKGPKGPSAEDIARSRLVSSAQQLASKNTGLGDIPRFIGQLGDVAVKNTDIANKCADTVREIAKVAGIKLGVSTTKTAVDSSILQRNGFGTGPDFADSIPGKMISASQVKPGDLALFKETSRDGRGTGAVTHVGIVIDPIKGIMVDASKAKGGVTQRAISTFKPSELFGFERPQALEELSKDKTGGGAVENFAGIAEKVKAAREKYMEFVADDYSKTVVKLGKDFEDALSGAQTPEDVSKIKAAYQEKLAQMRTEQAQALQGDDITDTVIQSGIDDAKTDYDARIALIESMKEITSAEIAAKRQAELAAFEARIKEIQTERATLSDSSVEQMQMKRQLTNEELQLVQQVKNTKQSSLQEALSAYQTDIQARRDLGRQFAEENKTGSQAYLAQYILDLQTEATMFSLTEAQKRSLSLETHQAQLQLDQERFASADQVSQSLEGSLSNFLQSSLAGTQSFAQGFQSLLKGVMNSIIQSLVQAIVKALALQVIMRGIFGIFGGPLGSIFNLFGAAGGGVDTAAGLASNAAFSSIPSGFPLDAFVGPVQSAPFHLFHSGGLVGRDGPRTAPDLLSDEVMAKLQIGEVVLSRNQVSNAKRAADAADSYSPSGGGGLTMHITVNGANADAGQIGRAIAQETKWRLQGVY